MKDKVDFSMEILLLNDLFRTKLIDKDIYDKAVQKLVTLHKNVITTEMLMVMASA